MSQYLYILGYRPTLEDSIKAITKVSNIKDI